MRAVPPCALSELVGDPAGPFQLRSRGCSGPGEEQRRPPSSLTGSCFAKARTPRSRRSSALIRASCGRRLEAVLTSAKRGTPFFADKIEGETIYAV